jgi:hypothetical protein
MKMGTIQKRAFEIKPGDVIQTDSDRLTVLHIQAESSKEIAFLCAYLDSLKPEPHIRRWAHKMTVKVEVNSPALTSAQQHADELVAMLQRCEPAFDNYPELSVAVDTLLEKVRPPEPPTLAEALEVLVSGVTLVGGDYKPGAFTDRANALLDRARRAGLLK